MMVRVTDMGLLAASNQQSGKPVRLRRLCGLRACERIGALSWTVLRAEKAWMSKQQNCGWWLVSDFLTV